MAKPDRHPSKRRRGEIPLRVLVDTCVWLDIAKGYRQKTLLGALEELVRAGKVELIVPQVVRDEFARNKTRIAEDIARGLSSVMKRVGVHWAIAASSEPMSSASSAPLRTSPDRCRPLEPNSSSSASRRPTISFAGTPSQLVAAAGRNPE